MSTGVSAANTSGAAAGAVPLLRADGVATAAVLSAVAGLLDAFAFLDHGHAFASFMTGNMVLFALHLVSGDGVAIFVLPLLAYAAGVVLAHGMLGATVRRALRGRPHVLALFVEAAVLCALAVLPHGLDDHLLVPVITLATAVQNTSFRSVGGRTYNSAFMTGNLQNLSGLFADGLAASDAAKLRGARDLAAVILAFFAGALGGGLLVPRLHLLTLLVPAGALVVLGAGLLCPRPSASPAG